MTTKENRSGFMSEKVYACLAVIWITLAGEQL